MRAIITEAVSRFSDPQRPSASHSICHYVIKDNRVFRQCYGQHVGFKVTLPLYCLILGRNKEKYKSLFLLRLSDVFRCNFTFYCGKSSSSRFWVCHQFGRLASREEDRQRCTPRCFMVGLLTEENRCLTLYMVPWLIRYQRVWYMHCQDIVVSWRWVYTRA